MDNVVIIVVIVIVSILGMFLLPQLLVKRAMHSVIRIFRQYGAVGIRSAKTAEELDITPQGVLERVLKPRDYKPRALQFLISVMVIQVTEEGKLYLSEETLASTRLEKGR